MLFCERNEFGHIGFNCLNPALHGGDGIALAPKADPASHHGAELAESHIGGSASVHASQVTAKHENLVGLKFRYPFRRIIRTRYSVVRSHIKYEGTNKIVKFALKITHFL